MIYFTRDKLSAGEYILMYRAKFREYKEMDSTAKKNAKKMVEPHSERKLVVSFNYPANS